MSDAAFSTVAAVYTVGGLLGALAAGPLASRRGRVLTMRATAACFLLGAGIESLAASPLVMGLGRLVAGIGAGASTVVVPLYISEVAPPAERGLFGAMTQVSINVGILGSQTLGFFLSYGAAWRWILGIGFFISVGQTLGLLAVPESPAWLAAHGKGSKARKILQRIRGSGFDITDEAHGWDDSEAAPEGERLLAEPDEDGLPTSQGPTKPVRHVGFVEVVRDPLTRPAIIACVGIMFAQQFCGINSIIMYSVSLLSDLLPISSALLTIIISVVNLVTTVSCAPLPDRIGRKTCLLASIIGQGSSSFLLALSIVLGIKVLSAVAVLLFVAFFAVGLGPVPFIMASEMVGQEAVGAAQSWALGSNYVATFLVAQFFLLVNNWLNEALGGAGWVYFLFAGFAFLSVLFVSWKVPETKGKKDVDEVWGRTRRVD
jgi:sugar porter (SP) family MFS transporter